MKHLSTHVEDDIAERFSALAKAHGGKSALLRRLVSMAVEAERPTSISLPDPVGRAVHLSVRLSENEVAAVRKAAASRSMKPSQWLRSVVRVRLGAGAQYPANELHELRSLVNQVRKVGVNLNQITRAVNEARREGGSFSVDARAVDAARDEVTKALTALHLMARGNVRTWEGEQNEE
ncbi:plasmid mobilization relaxosome protein MobC (plasmid) [Rhizobium pusense]|uniref:Plasmid mobilization relaxosome protein MobC n=2 Tax=Agrobacterium pusense TaxID=648995 RepID=A0AA44EG03_9HYPH|nr:plasmid mobilization relaxosome protein MobC [Agrobacterium pusense]NRF18036.1 plasmid mobilization relaxosome protein MobC [Agrobacterium pusense]